MIIQDIETRLKKADHWFEYSDDHSEFKRGHSERELLIVELKQLPYEQALDLVYKHVPYECGRQYFRELLPERRSA